MRATLLKKVSKSERINAQWILSLRSRLRLTQEGLARLLDASSRTVARWEKGDGLPEPYMQKKLLGIHRVACKLEKAGEPEDISAWLETPDPGLRGYAPADLLGSAYATEELVERIEEWGQGAY